MVRHINRYAIYLSAVVFQISIHVTDWVCIHQKTKIRAGSCPGCGKKKAWIGFKIEGFGISPFGNQTIPIVENDPPMMGFGVAKIILGGTKNHPPRISGVTGLAKT
jgi:hypothetical protein